jgi:DNA-binding NarL/FixJ family response regulator
VTIKVLLADDQAMVRSGFRLILESQPGITVAAEAADGIQAVALARELRPDVCLVDIRMPGQDGIEVTRALAGPGVADPLRVVIVTTFDTDEYVYGALRAGAVGFLLKDAGPPLLIEAVRAASAGDALISPSVTVRLLERLARQPAARSRESAVAAGTRHRPQHRARPDEPGNSCRAVHLAQHGQDSPGPHPEQARRTQPGGNRHLVLGEPDHERVARG